MFAAAWMGVAAAAGCASPVYYDGPGMVDNGPPSAPSDSAAVLGIDSATAVTSASAAPVASVATPPSAPKKLPAGMKILVIGDSFAEAMGAGLRAREPEFGVKAVLRGEKATFIPEWAGPNKGVPLMLEQVKPDLVVIALGGNELAMVDPTVRGPKVEKLVGFMGATPCVWVSPPLWDIKDNGLLEIIRKRSSPCRYFDSNVLSPNLPRGSDKIHPTAEGQKIWAKTFLEWLEKEQAGDGAHFALAPRPASE